MAKAQACIFGAIILDAGFLQTVLWTVSVLSSYKETRHAKQQHLNQEANRD
jgi:hypothetical protein